MTKPFSTDQYRNSPVTPNGFQSFEGLNRLAEGLSKHRLIIADALHFAEGTHTVDDIILMVMSGRLRWWYMENSFMLTEIIQYPQMSLLHVFLAGGDLDEIKARHSDLVSAAKQAGCKGLTLAGRRGWAKALSDIGWKEASTNVAFMIGDDNG